MSKAVQIEPAVLLEWEDSQSLIYNVWNDKADIVNQECPRIATIGFVLHEDKEKIIVAASKGGDQASGDMVIPKSAIRKRRRLYMKK